MKRIFISISLIFSIIFTSSSVADQVQLRAIFDERFNWLTPSEADHTLETIKNAGFNVFIPCIWHGRGTTWPSTMAPKEPLWTKKANEIYDPLQYLISKAHSMGIQVHVWFTIALRQRNFLNQYYDHGVNSKFFNLHNIDFRNFIVDLVIEVLDKYDIDGINLDYVRVRDVCVNSACIQQYFDLYNRNLLHDLKFVNKSKSSWIYISKFNSIVVDDIIKRISYRAKHENKDIILSVDTHVGRKGFELQGANAAMWANSDWIDIIYHMDYSNKLDLAEINNGLNLIRDPNKFVLLVGNYKKPVIDKYKIQSRDPDLFIDQVKYALNLNKYFNSVGVYQYSFLSNSQIEILKNDVFKNPAVFILP